MNVIIKGLNGIRTLLKVLGAAALVGMMMITCIDVVGRFLKHPIFGSVEITGFLASLTVIMALSYTHEMSGHIGVEILVRHFSRTVQDIIELLTNLISLALCGVITWRMFLYARTIERSGEVSMNLQFPEHIIIYICSVCFFVLAITMIEETINLIKRLIGNK